MKQAQEIYRDMLSVFREKTGFSMADSSDLAVRLYAAAAEIETLYVYGDWVLAQSFPQTAAGEYLDLHAALRGLRRADASAATGTLRFSLDEARSADVTVPAGTVCLTAGLTRFVTTEGGVIAAGETSCNVAARAEESGESGNADAGTVTQMALPPTGVSACTNPAAFTGGRDAEDDETLRARVLESFVRLPNGANAAFYETRARSHEGVGGVEVKPRSRGAGTVDVIVAGTAGVPSQALLDEIEDDLASVREIAVDVQVLAPQTVSVDVTAQIRPADGVSAAAAIAAAESAIRRLFTGERLGKPLYLAELGKCVYDTGLVKNYAFTAPQADIAAVSGTLPVCGTVTVTEGA
ncbi:MAG: baseplate J/gp47 family protein [Oscillospiraceae bacterium]|nr:baseplate J/gp47 family protein [Oscillospiraceae bacterium]